MANPIERITAKGQLIPLTFLSDAVAASQTDAQLTIIEATGAPANDAYLAPFDGEVIAISVDLVGTAATAGSLTVGASVGGTEDADTTVTLTTGKTSRKVLARGQAKFAAGARLGAQITSSADWDGTGLDLCATLWVLLYLDGVGRGVDS